MSRPRRHSSAPTHLVHRLSRPALEAAYERLASECDRLANRLMVLEAQVRGVGRANARFVDRAVRAEHRADTAESALEAASSKPAAMARAVLRCETMLYRISYPTCGVCHAVPPPHQKDCAVATLLIEIGSLFPE